MEKMGWTYWEWLRTPVFVIEGLFKTWTIQAQAIKDEMEAERQRHDH